MSATASDVVSVLRSCTPTNNPVTLSHADPAAINEDPLPLEAAPHVVTLFNTLGDLLEDAAADLGDVAALEMVVGSLAAISEFAHMVVQDMYTAQAVAALSNADDDDFAALIASLFD